jgi:hypothetical protein
MDNQSEKFMDRIRADQEEAERDEGRINAAKAALLDLMRLLTRTWQRAVDVAEDPPELKSAAALLIWSGCAEMRVEMTVYSDAPPVRAQIVRIGGWTRQVTLDEVKRQLAHFVRGAVAIQEESRWELRLTREGENVQQELRGHPEDGWIAWQYVVRNKVPPRIAFRLLETPPVQGGPTAISSSEANASIGDVVVQNHIDFEPVAREIGRALREELSRSTHAAGGRAGTGGAGEGEAREAQPSSGDGEGSPSAGVGSRRGPARLPLKDAQRYVRILRKWAKVQEENEGKTNAQRTTKEEFAGANGTTEPIVRRMQSWYRNQRNAHGFPRDPRNLTDEELAKHFPRR